MRLNNKKRYGALWLIAITVTISTYNSVLAKVNISPLVSYLLDDSSIEEGILVSNDEELEEALSDVSQSVITLAPGNYSLSDMVAGLNRSSLPLTIRGQFPNNKPVFTNASQSLSGSSHITFKDLRFESTAALQPNGFWFYDGSLTNNIVLDGLEFFGPRPASLTDTTPDANYSDNMARLFRFSNYQTHTYTIKNIYAEYVFSVGDFRMNGEVLMDNIVVDKWYFDGIRILGQGTEGYVEGNRIIAHVDLTDNLAVYEEMGNRAPHPDNTQKFNNGNPVNNTNPMVTNTLFYQNRFNPGQLRSNNTQSGLSQSYELNVGYIENIYGTKASPHGISLEAGANGVLIERNSLVDIDWSSSPWVRIFRADGQIAVHGNYFKGGYNLGSGGNINLDGYELDDSDNQVGGAYADFFNGPGGQEGVSGLMSMFTPKSSLSVGALNVSGEWRGLPHRPMMASAPDIVAGTNQFRLTQAYSPTLWSPNQARLGANNCSAFHLRWSVANAYTWTKILNVINGMTVSSVPAGNIDVQTLCVNIAGEGLWSHTATITVN